MKIYGFRSKTTWKMALAGFAYGLVAMVIVIAIIDPSSEAPNTTQVPAVSTATTPDKVKPAVEAIKITAADLTAAYESNEVKADQTYKEKTADITGTVDNVGVSFGSTYVVLSSGKEYSIIGIQCFFKDKAEIDKVAELKKGDKVTIQGIIDGESMNVVVKDCILK